MYLSSAFAFLMPRQSCRRQWSIFHQAKRLSRLVCRQAGEAARLEYVWNFTNTLLMISFDAR